MAPDLISLYVAHLRSQGIWPDTLRSYASVLHDFRKFCGTWEVDAATVEGYVEWKGGALGARAKRRACLRGFYRWAESEGHVACRVHSSIGWLRPRPYERQSKLTDDELERLLSFVPKTEEDRLAHALVAFALGVGLYLREVRALEVYDVRLDLGYVVARGRTLHPLAPWVWRALAAYRPDPVGTRERYGRRYLNATAWECHAALRGHGQRLGIRRLAYRRLHSVHWQWKEKAPQ